jgi:hypothetical protein
MECELNSFGSGQRPTVGSCEQVNELSSPIKRGEFVN